MITDIMISLSTENVCIYLCICMSSLTLTASMLALYILISLTKYDNKSETVENDRQEGRQRAESVRPRPLCLNTQL